MSAMTLRLTDELNAKLRMIADVDDETVADVVREALDAWCARRFADEEFREEAQRRLDRMSKMLLEGKP